MERPVIFSSNRMWSWAPALLTVAACTSTVSPQPTENFDIQFENYTLDNGLEVVLHEDHSDPVVMVTTLVHAGSNRDRSDRSGLAHLFEHLSFNDSENTPHNSTQQLIPEMGGTWHGSTSLDATTYYEVVSKDALETALWINSDRLGYMISTVTEGALRREQNSVWNEKQQLSDNSPYGHTQTVRHNALYPVDHPYHWTGIGAADSLQNITIGNVQSFFQRFYGAANTTLVIAGDIDINQTKILVDYWFGEISRGADIPLPYPQPVYLETSHSLMHEDALATLPELQIAFPTVEQFHGDYYALELLTELLAGYRAAPLNKIIVEQRQLGRDVSVHHRSGQIAGELIIRVRADSGVDLQDVKEAVEVGLARFGTYRLQTTALERAKMRIVRKWHDALANITGKSLALARLSAFTADPGFVNTLAERTLAVTPLDVLKVHERYLRNRPSIMTSFVPLGRPELAVDGAEPATVAEETIDPLSNEETVSREDRSYYRTLTQADRSEPPLDDPPQLTIPTVWQSRQANGLAVYGIETFEEPLVIFDLVVPGGQLLDPPEKIGVAGLLASLLMDGTSEKTLARFEETLDLLGARITIKAEREAIRLSGSTFSRTFEPVMKLAQELLLEPHWEEASFERLRHQQLTRLRDQQSDPIAIADAVFDRAVYGDNHAFGFPVSGTPDTVADIEIDDLKRYYQNYLSPSQASLHIAGPVSQARVEAVLADLSTQWPARDVEIMIQPPPPQVNNATVYFVDVPGAKQSLLRVGLLAMSGNDPDYLRLSYANERFGGGSNGRLFQQLRVEKGYTSEATSHLTNGLETVAWIARTSVRSDVTIESLKLLNELIKTYATTFTEEDVTLTKSQVLRRKARTAEPLQAKLELLGRMSQLGLAPEVLRQQQEILLAMNLEDFREIIETYLDANRMVYVVVGDARTLLARMSELGYGEPVLLDTYGQRL